MTATYVATRNIIITGALRLVHGIGQSETPTNDQYTECAEALNLMMKGWQGIGNGLWARKYQVLTFDAKGQWVFAESAPMLATLQAQYQSNITSADYTFLSISKPLQIYNLYMRDTTSGTQYEVSLVSNQDFEQLGTINSTSEPNQYTFESYESFSVLKTYPKPSTATIANKQLIMWYKRPVEDLTGASDIPDFPSEWHEAIKYGLAVRLAPEYDLNTQDRASLKQDFSLIYAEAMAANNESDSFYFQPDIRMHHSTGRR